jgi:uncharacterized membrane protein
MSELVAVMYPEVYRAGEVCAILQRLHGELLIDIEDAAYVTRESDGKLKLHQTVPVVASATGAGMFSGSFWGLLIGFLFLQPIAGMAAGAALGAAGGALTGKLVDYGIPDSFMKELGQKVQPGTSVLFVLFRKVSVDKVLNQVAQFGGTVMHSSLSEEAEAKLQAALAEGGEPQKAA